MKAFKNMKPTTSKDLRNKLPGFRQEIVLASYGKKKLSFIYDVRGCFDELLSVSNYWLTDGTKTDTFDNLNDATLAWDKF